MSRKKFFLLVVICGALGAIAFFLLFQNNDAGNKELLPAPRPYEPSPLITVTQAPSATQTGTVTPVPTITATKPTAAVNEINLAIPFTSQAPKQNWDAAHEQFCEEAAVLMVASYVLGRDIPDVNYADEQLFAIKTFEEKRFGYFEDTTAEETAVILREYYKISQVTVVYDPAIADITQALSQGKAVIVPAAGRELGNPYFTAPGPLYHMLVIKGYTKEGRFITNDAGTRRGANYLYDPNVVLNAIHDWNGGDVEHGRKVIIVVG